MTDLQGAIDAINPNSTDEEWTRLLAEAMNAADEIAALREALSSICAAQQVEPYRGWNLTELNRAADKARALLGLPSVRDLNPDIAAMQDHAEANKDAIRAILSKQEPEYSGWVEVVDEGESGNDAIAAIGGDRG